MRTEKLSIHSEEFDLIVEDIKKRNLSRDNMPKLIVGTGLSCTYKVPGMTALAAHLNREINKISDSKIKAMWGKHYTDIVAKGLEAGLKNISETEIPVFVSY